MAISYKINEYVPREAHVTAVLETLRRGQLTEGERVAEFEAAWAKRIGSSCCVAFSSGTAALLASMFVLRERNASGATTVAMNALSYPAAVNVATLLDLDTVFLDTDWTLFGNIAPAEFEQVTDSAKVDVLVIAHLFGRSNDMDEIMTIAARRDCVVVEDAAQSAGGRRSSRQLGSWARIAVYSFNAGHQLRAGEMGAVTCEDTELAAALRRFKNNGREVGSRWTDTFRVSSVGLNLKTSEISASLALSELPFLEESRLRRLKNVRQLSQALQPVAHAIRWADFDDESNPFAFPIICKNRTQRDELGQRLLEASIEVRPMFSCLPALPALRMASNARKHVWRAAAIAECGLYIGCHEYLSDADIDFVSRVLVREAPESISEKR